MNCPNCQSTKEPVWSRTLPMGYFCPDCGGDDTAPELQQPLSEMNTAFAEFMQHAKEHDEALANFKAILADPHKVMLNMLHGTIAWTPETLRRVLGPDPVRAALEYLLDCTEDPPSPNCSCHVSPPCYDCVDYGGLRDAIAAAKKALTDTQL